MNKIIFMLYISSSKRTWYYIFEVRFKNMFRSWWRRDDRHTRKLDQKVKITKVCVVIYIKQHIYISVSTVTALANFVDYPHDISLHIIYSCKRFLDQNVDFHRKSMFACVEEVIVR